MDRNFTFVRFEERYQDGSASPCTLLVSGEAAESPENFLKWYSGGAEMVVLDWLPASDICASPAFEAIINLDVISSDKMVSDMLIMIFDAGYQLAMKKMAKSSSTTE